jgi:hypothetical protein
VKWSGLTTVDAKCGLEGVKAELSHKIVNGRAYWFSTLMSSARMNASTVAKTPTGFLLPNYDEYTVGYTSVPTLN